MVKISLTRGPVALIFDSRFQAAMDVFNNVRVEYLFHKMCFSISTIFPFPFRVGRPAAQASGDGKYRASAFGPAEVDEV